MHAVVSFLLRTPYRGPVGASTVLVFPPTLPPVLLFAVHHRKERSQVLLGQNCCERQRAPLRLLLRRQKIFIKPPQPESIASCAQAAVASLLSRICVFRLHPIVSLSDLLLSL